MGRQRAATIRRLAIPLLFVRRLAFGLAGRWRKVVCRFRGQAQADLLPRMLVAQVGGGRKDTRRGLTQAFHRMMTPADRSRVREAQEVPPLA